MRICERFQKHTSKYTSAPFDTKEESRIFLTLTAFEGGLILERCECFHDHLNGINSVTLLSEPLDVLNDEFLKRSAETLGRG